MVKAIVWIMCMIVGLATIIGLFALRIVGMIAAIVGGFALLETFFASVAYSHAPTPAHWLALQHIGSFAAISLAVVIAAWYAPMWLFSERAR
jgi:ABC-type transport system involved in cytochrome c biogenesis permease subunit